MSQCSGIEAASVAWKPLGWTPVAFAENDSFPSAVLAHHYPDVPNLGDITKFQEWPDYAVDVVCGGTPCQSFSVAGLRKGLADPRGNLALTFLAIVDRYRPRYVLWENVPGVLSSDGGRDFAAFLGGLGQLGYGWCFRVLDAQYARVDGFAGAVPQRRRRVFVVGYLGDWRRAAAVLSEPESVLGDTPPRREAGKGVARPIGAGSPRGSGYRNDADTAENLVASTLSASRGTACAHAADLETYVPEIVSQAMSSKWSKGSSGPAGDEVANLVAHSLRAEGFDAGEDGTGRGTPLVPICFSAKDHGADALENLSPTLRAGGHSESHANAGVMPAIAFDTTQITSKANYSRPQPGDPCHPLAAGAHAPAVAFQTEQEPKWAHEVSPTLKQPSPSGGGQPTCVQQGWAVRRLTPKECARLQGFPDDYLDITFNGKPAADGPKYKALGNSWAVNVIRWIGLRMEMVEALAGEQIAEAAE